MNVTGFVARILFNLANFIDDDCVLDMACDIAMDNGFGYCEDCSPESNEWRD